jgi:hypothetical protein
MCGSSRKQIRAPAARPKGAKDEEIRECADAVRGHHVFYGLRVAEHGPLLWHWLSGFRHERQRSGQEHRLGERSSLEIAGQQEGAGSEHSSHKDEARTTPGEFRPIAPLLDAISTESKPRDGFPGAIMPRPPRRLLRCDAACAPRSLFRRFPRARNRSARIPWNSFRAPGSWRSARSRS